MYVCRGCWRLLRGGGTGSQHGRLQCFGHHGEVPSHTESSCLHFCCLVGSHLPTLVCLLHPASLSLSLSPLSKPAMFIEKKTQTIETTKTTTSIVYQAMKPLGTHSINCLFPDSVARSTSSSLHSVLAHWEIKKSQFTCFITCLHCALYLSVHP